MTVSVFELFTIGIGPSSSHTVGPMRGAKRFVDSLREKGLLQTVHRVKSELYGSLGATGIGHGSTKAVLMGLEGEQPETVDITSMAAKIETIKDGGRIRLAGIREIDFAYRDDLLLHRKISLPFHPNGMIFSAYDAEGRVVATSTYYSVGGGFVIDESTAELKQEATALAFPFPFPFPFTTAADLLTHCADSKLACSDIMLANERSWRSESEIRSGLLKIWRVMQECVSNGCNSEGILPGGLNVKRRAPTLYQQLQKRSELALIDPLGVTDWVTLYALAVSEENAAGGRVVTAPTNGAAGIIPAVLHYYTRFHAKTGDEDVIRFLLTAAAIGLIYKENASISGAEVGCQGEVGAACSMAAGALAEVLGGTPAQVENAAEIAMEHNLGLTCDPVGGLVQVPCIERNAMAAIKAISAARMALHGDGTHFVSLDKVIKTMRDTGRDMQDKYKETSRGGLAVNVIEVPVNIIEC